MQKWEYMTLCPDSHAGYEVMLREVGEEGWEAVCAWSHHNVSHILYKRPVVTADGGGDHKHEFYGWPAGVCECGAHILPPGWITING